MGKKSIERVYGFGLWIDDGEKGNENNFLQIYRKQMMMNDNDEK
jgi:hypothetical protein